MVAAGNDPAFRRNIANRLWQIVFGRGVVEPVDLLHSANPPVNPALLDLLAQEIATLRFDMKAFLRELTLTQAFQRSLDPPAPTPELAQAIADRLPALEQEASTLTAVAAVCEEAWIKARDLTRQAQLAAAPLNAEVQKLEAAATAAQKTLTTVQEAAEKAAAALAAKREVHAAVLEAATKAGTAAAKVPEAAELASGAKAFQEKAAALAGEVSALEKAGTTATEAVHAPKAALATAQQAVETARAPLREATQKIAALQTALDAASSRKQTERIAAKHAIRLAAEARAAHAWTVSPDPAHEETLTKAWAESFAGAQLIPLQPEQLCWSIMQATGVLATQRAEATAEWEKKYPLTEADRADAVKQAARSAGIESAFREKLRAHEAQFVSLFGGAAGQPQSDFFATPEQALYFANADPVRSWTQALAKRLLALPDVRALAEELYLCTLTRPPEPVEVAELESTLATRPEQKQQVLADASWALLTSVEFRFSH